MDAIDGLNAVTLAPRNIDDACTLVAEAGWNQTADDWAMMIEAGHGVGLEDDDERLVASALTLPYGTEFGWISMVLVAKNWRRKGIASSLLRDCIRNHLDAGRVPVLDATPAGEKVYERLGFTGQFTIRRWETARPGAGHRDPEGVREISPDDLTRLIAYDRDVFQGDRASVLLDIGIRRGAHGWVLEREQGYLLSREGRLARQLGPLCADSEVGAHALIAAALGHFSEPVFVDVPDRHTGITDVLAERGFTPQRPFRRMFKGDGRGFGDIDRTFALAGPELG